MNSWTKAGLVAMATLVTAGMAQAKITASKHDFSGTGWAIGGSGSAEICVPCHAPHNNLGTGNLLWNHTDSTATYQLFQGLDMQSPTPTNLATVSKSCMGCHDGTVALDSFGGNSGSHFATGGANMGNNLRNDHPVSIRYDTSIASSDGELFNPSVKTVAALGGGTIADTMLVGGNQLECSSCHDVHNSYNLPSMLKIDNAGSKLCLTCHDK